MTRPLQQSVAACIAAGIASMIHAALVLLNLLGDRSVFYVVTCVITAGTYLCLTPFWSKPGRSQFVVHTPLGFLVGAIAGYVCFSLYSGGRLYNPRALIAASNRGLLNAIIVYWCFSTGVFGATFSSTLWFVKNRLANTKAAP